MKAGTNWAMTSMSTDSGDTARFIDTIYNAFNIS